MNTLGNFLFLIYFIGGAKFEAPQSQSDFFEYLGNYNGNDGLEPISPIRVIKEVYASSNLDFLHFFISLSQNYFMSLKCGLVLTLLMNIL